MYGNSLYKQLEQALMVIYVKFLKKKKKNHRNEWQQNDAVNLHINEFL